MERPQAPAASVAPKASAPARAQVPSEDVVTPLRGPAARVVSNMEDSLEVPTATSVRAIPAKLLVDNRIVINNHLKRARGGKVSFTHLIGWALIQALKEFPSQNVYYSEVDGKPSVVAPAHVNFGIAIDLPKPDGTRALLVLGLYVLAIRPQRARARALAEVRAGMSVGSRVMTTAGIHATVVSLDDESTLLEVAPGVHVRFATASVVRLLDEPTA